MIAIPTVSIERLQFLRVLLIGSLVLVLQVPIILIHGLIAERRSTRDAALAEVTRTWGGPQRLFGPVLAVPYLERWTQERDGRRETQAIERHALFLPESLQIDGSVVTEVRNRGIFEVPVYRLTVSLNGQFAPATLAERGIAPEDTKWDRAQLWIELSEARSIRNQAALRWGSQSIGFLPGTGLFGSNLPGIHVPVEADAARAGGTFAIELILDGSGAVSFAPIGRKTTAHLKSNWPDPSFQGSWLPDGRRVSAAGFEAEWSIASLGRNYPQAWTSKAPVGKELLAASVFGFDLLTPVDPYRMAERSVKYECLFLALTFLSLWLFEVLTKRKIHSLQYLLVGAAMCVFYLLELSLAEHLGFGTAYLLASLAVVGLITHYCVAVLCGAGRAIGVGLLVAGLYAFLYVLLRNDDYALLAGSVGLFLALTVVMVLTRKIDWDRLGR